MKRLARADLEEYLGDGTLDIVKVFLRDVAKSFLDAHCRPRGRTRSYYTPKQFLFLIVALMIYRESTKTAAALMEAAASPHVTKHPLARFWNAYRRWCRLGHEPYLLAGPCRDMDDFYFVFVSADRLEEAKHRFMANHGFSGAIKQFSIYSLAEPIRMAFERLPELRDALSDVPPERPKKPLRAAVTPAEAELLDQIRKTEGVVGIELIIELDADADIDALAADPLVGAIKPRVEAGRVVGYTVKRRLTIKDTQK